MPLIKGEALMYQVNIINDCKSVNNVWSNVGGCW